MSSSLRTSSVRDTRVCRVLIVDDNADSSELLQLLLEPAGYEVMIADNAAKALQLGAEFFPQVALLDIGLPGMNGYELAAEMRTRPEFTACRFIAVTGYSGPQFEERCARAGFANHVTKPVDMHALLALLAEVSHAHAQSGAQGA